MTETFAPEPDNEGVETPSQDYLQHLANQAVPRQLGNKLIAAAILGGCILIGLALGFFKTHAAKAADRTIADQAQRIEQLEGRLSKLESQLKAGDTNRLDFLLNAQLLADQTKAFEHRTTNTLTQLAEEIAKTRQDAAKALAKVETPSFQGQPINVATRISDLETNLVAVKQRAEWAARTADSALAEMLSIKEQASEPKTIAKAKAPNQIFK